MGCAPYREVSIRSAGMFYVGGKGIFYSSRFNFTFFASLEHVQGTQKLCLCLQNHEVMCAVCEITDDPTTSAETMGRPTQHEMEMCSIDGGCRNVLPPVQSCTAVMVRPPISNVEMTDVFI